jgi:hypothetical protein
MALESYVNSKNIRLPAKGEEVDLCGNLWHFAVTICHGCY